MSIIQNLKNLFSPSETKSSAVPLSLMDETGWGVYRSLFRPNRRIRYTENSAFDAYRAHELVFACVNKIADVMNDAEIIVETKNNEGEWKRVEGHPLQALFKRPNSMQTGRDVRRLMVQSEQGSGRFVIILNRSSARIPVEMEIINPNRIEPKWDRTKETITHYEYTRKDGKKINVPVEDVLMRRRADLLDQFYGFAPAAAALKSVNSDLGLSDYVDAFFESDGTPSGVLKFLGGVLNDTKKEELAAKWRLKYARGGSNQKGIAVIDQNMDYQAIGSKLDELASDSLGNRFESRICSVFGVPPILVGALVGLTHTTANATAKAALRDFWDNKVSPELAVLREWLTWFVLPLFEDLDKIKREQIRVNYDISQAAFLQDDIDKIHDRARKNFALDIWTKNEAREATALPPVENGDVFRSEIVSAKQPNLLPEAGNTNTGESSEKSDTDSFKPLFSDVSGTKLLNGKPLAGDALKKTFEYNGLILAREPRGVELVIDLKSLVSDFETEKQKAVDILLKFRNELITQASENVEELTTETIYQLTLTPNSKTRKQIEKILRAAYKRGRAQIIEELTAQRNAKNITLPLETKDLFDDEDEITEQTDLTISKIISEIQVRAVNVFVTLKTLGIFTLDKLKENLLGESTKFIESQAGNAVNAVIRAGRADEIENTSDEWHTLEYSAILDVNTCKVCSDADGKTAESIKKLPDAPNPECKGGAQCRCFIVAIAD